MMSSIKDGLTDFHPRGEIGRTIPHGDQDKYLVLAMTIGRASLVTSIQGDFLLQEIYKL